MIRKGTGRQPDNICFLILNILSKNKACDCHCHLIGLSKNKTFNCYCYLIRICPPQKKCLLRLRRGGYCTRGSDETCHGIHCWIRKRLVVPDTVFRQRSFVQLQDPKVFRCRPHCVTAFLARTDSGNMRAQLLRHAHISSLFVPPDSMTFGCKSSQRPSDADS